MRPSPDTHRTSHDGLRVRPLGPSRLKALACLAVAAIAASTLSAADEAPAAAADPLGPICPAIGPPQPMALPAVASAATVSPGTTLVGVNTGAPFIRGRIDQAAWHSTPREPIPVAYSGTYTVTVDDIGSRIYQVATVSNVPDESPCGPWTVGAASASVFVKAASALRLRSRSASAGKPPALTVRVAQEGSAPVRGFLTISWQGPRAGSHTVRFNQPNGQARTLRLPALEAGSYTLRGSFTDTSGRTMDATSGPHRLRIGTRR